MKTLIKLNAEYQTYFHSDFLVNGIESISLTNEHLRFTATKKREQNTFFYCGPNQMVAMYFKTIGEFAVYISKEVLMQSFIETYTHQDSIMLFSSNHYDNCGLNSDWCVSAWHIFSANEDKNTGIFVIDREDNTRRFSIVERSIDDDGEYYDKIIFTGSKMKCFGVAASYLIDHQQR